MDILAVACALVAAALYYNTLYAGFVYDDRRAILTNGDLKPSTPWARLLENDFWGTPLHERGSHGSYRPLCVATYRLNYLLGGLDPFGYHLVNVLLHALCTGLVIRVARRVLPGRRLAQAVAGLLFAVHPVHSEAVAGVVGRADLLACLFAQAAFLAFAQHRERPTGPALGAALLCALLASLAKETGLSSLALCLLWDLGQRRAPDGSGGVLAAVLAVLSLGRLRLAGGRTPEFASADNPVARHPSRLVRGLTFLYLPAASLGMLLCPCSLSFDWSMDAVPLVQGISDPRNLQSLMLYASLAGGAFWAARGLRTRRTLSAAAAPSRRFRAPKPEHCPGFGGCGQQLCLPATPCGSPTGCVGRRPGTCHTDGCRAANNNNAPVSECHCPKRKPTIPRRRESHAAGGVLTVLGFLVLPFLPASNLFFYVGFVIAERILYLPSIGTCLAVGAAISASYDLARRSAAPRLAKTILVLTGLLLGSMSARTFLRNQDWYNEENLYRSALSINPPKAYGNLGSVLSALGRTSEAELAFIEALRYRPNMADVHYNLGILQQGRHNYEEAIRSYQRAIHFRPSLAQAYVNLGATLVSLGRSSEAAVVLRAGASLDGSALKDRKAHEAARVQALLQLGSLYAEQGRLHKALSSYREALSLLPEHYPPQSVYNLLGETLSRLNQYSEAEKWFQASLASQPDHVPAHITYGKLLARNSSRISEAERWFLRARRLAPQEPSVHHHYGLFLNGQGRLEEAAASHLEAARLARSDYELAVAAASGLRRAGRCAEAEHWYRHALGLRPQEARSHANLGAILHLNGKYKQAAAAYRQALRLQPGDPTTITNLHKLAALLV